MGIRPLLQFPHLLRAGPVLLTLQFPPLVPLSYQVLRGPIYSFPLVRYSCLLSAGVLHARLCLKVYSWCIHGERRSPCPPTPLPSCSLSTCDYSQLGVPASPVGKNLLANAGDARKNVGSIPGSGISSGRWNSNPVQYSCLEMPWTEEVGGL